MEAAVEAWLSEGGWVVASSDRAARALVEAHGAARRARGETGWPAPRIVSYNNFVLEAWAERATDGRVLLNRAQELHVWNRVLSEETRTAATLKGPRQRLAEMAMEARALLCEYAPQYLKKEARRAWTRDAAAMSTWLEAFDDACAEVEACDAGRLPLELTALLCGIEETRAPLLLTGFDRLLPAQKELLDAWGRWQLLEAEEAADHRAYFVAQSMEVELAACARWCAERLTENPEARLMVLTLHSDRHRGPLERAFLRHCKVEGRNVEELFEFSLGVPLLQTALARGALQTLHWLAGRELNETELDWIFASGQLARSEAEHTALLTTMRVLRARGEERPQWSLTSFAKACTGVAQETSLAEWRERTHNAAMLLRTEGRAARGAMEWSDFVLRLLREAGWPGYKPLTSAEFQGLQHWQRAVETTGSLGFDGRRMRFAEFVEELENTLNAAVYAAESRQTPILIAGLAESAGLTADAIWFLGADEANWPTSGSAHPLLPWNVQREAQMPHATAQLDGERAEVVTRRAVASAAEFVFSYARQTEDTEARPSRIAEHWAGAARELPQDLRGDFAAYSQAFSYFDESSVPFPAGPVKGGAGVLTAQSNCPFRAFATTRLGAREMEFAQEGLNAKQRGQLLHAAMHSIWKGKPDGLGSLQDLLDVADRQEYARKHVEAALRAGIREELRERVPARYLELEADRLTRLIEMWLEYEATRADFQVEGTEMDQTISLAGLTLRLRLDRMDLLHDGTYLVMDYKTGDMKPTDWDLPRMKDAQLPLYAGFALGGKVLNGLVYAKIRPEKREFAGRVANAKETLLPDLKGTSALVKRPMSAEDLLDWRDAIEKLARDFLEGRAEVNPNEQETCERCTLHCLCRVQEQEDVAARNNEESGIEEDSHE